MLVATPALKRSPTHAAGFGGAADAVGGRGDRGAARVDLEPALPHFESGLAIELGHARLGRAGVGGGFRLLRTAPAAVPQRASSR